jgi:hypothetical protein
MRTRAPRTWLGLLALAGFLLDNVGFALTFLPSARVPGRVVEVTGAWIFVPAVAAWTISQTSQALRKKPDGRPDLGWLSTLTFMLGVGAAWVLVFLATQGNAAALGTHSAHVNSRGLLPGLEAFVLAECLLYALLFGPEIVRRKLPFEHATEQALRLVPAGLALGAAIVTGSYMLALHFFNEPLAKIPPGPLTASIVAVMALLTPFYQLIARACWRYGLADLLDPAAWWAKGQKMADEIRFFRFNQGYRKMKEEQSADAMDAAGSTEHPNQADT